MKTCRNFAMGAALAAIVLAPAAWADGRLALKGQVPDRSSLRIATVLPLGHALAAARAAFPNLTHCAQRIIGAAQASAGSLGNRNGA